MDKCQFHRQHLVTMLHTPVIKVTLYLGSQQELADPMELGVEMLPFVKVGRTCYIVLV